MLIDFFLIFGISVLLQIIIFLSRQKEFSKNILVFLLLYFLFFNLQFYALSHKINWLWALCVCFSHGIGYVSGPLIYFYVKSLLIPNRVIIRTLFKHLIPYFVIWICFVLPFSLSVFFKDYSVLNTMYNNHVKDIATVIYFVDNLYFLSYSITALFLTKNIKQNKKLYTLFHRELDWLKTLIYGVIIIASLDAIFSTFDIFFFSLPISNIGIKLCMLEICFFCFLVYKGIFQSKILIPVFEKDLNKFNDSLLSEKPKNQQMIEETFSKKELSHLENKIYVLMKNEKLYRNKSLNLRELAIKMEVTDKKLTDFINQYLNTNFQMLINYYRTKDFKKKILYEDNKKFTLFSIAQECGFNSKASFNRVFKQFEKCTPTEFLKKHQNVTA